MRNSPFSFGKSDRLKGMMRQRGLTLIELMVSLVLGLILIGGVLNIFVSNRETFRVTENLARMQENARTGFDFMARDLRETGQNPCGTHLVSNVIRSASNAIPWWANWNKGTMIGVDGSQDRTDIVAFGTTAKTRVAGTDAVLVIRADQDEKTIQSHNATTYDITLPTVTGLDVDDVVMACDLKGAAIFQIGTINSGTKVVSYDPALAGLNCGGHLRFLAPVDNCPTTDITLTAGGLLAKLTATFWYVGYNDKGQRSLYRTRIIKKTIAGVSTITTEPEEIVPGVQDMQMQYLAKSAITGTLALDWVEATDAATFPGATSTATGNWRTDDPTNQPNQAVAVRVTMTLQSDEKVGTDQLPIQRQLIHVVGLRSRDTIF